MSNSDLKGFHDRESTPRRSICHRRWRAVFEPLEHRLLLAGDILEMVQDSPPTPPAGTIREMVQEYPSTAVILADVPTSTWTYGCTATSAGMIFGYYDRVGYGNMYAGPTNGGIAPLTNLGQGQDPAHPIQGSTSLIATQAGFDGRSAGTDGHVDDYWAEYKATGPDPYVGKWTEHQWADCTADFLGTNQWKYSGQRNGPIDRNTDGATRVLYDPTGAKVVDYTDPQRGLPATDASHGLRLFAESRGYSVITNFTQQTDNAASGGFSFSDYRREIDAGRPVMIQLTGHSMVGIGYEPTSQTVYVHDTWDNNTHSMSWGGSYTGKSMQAVTVIQLAAQNHVVNGTAGNDTIRLTPHPSIPGIVDVYLNNSTTTPSYYLQMGTGSTITINGVAGDDVIDVSALTMGVTINGGDGNDSIQGGGGADNINGNAGNDSLRGGPGNDTLGGGQGDDVLSGGAGSDVFNGGAGIDLVDFTNQGNAVTVTLDGVANDGPGDYDNVGPNGDIENVTGGSGNDLLVGNGLANSLQGGPGNDTLWGGDGNDTLGGGQNDDEIHGGAGSDALYSGAGVNKLYGDNDNDVFYTRNGSVDTLDGGNGYDQAQVDSNDLLSNVESLLA